MRKPIRANRRWRQAIWVAAAALVLLVPQAPSADEFEDYLALVDRGLKHNPSRVNAMAIKSCRSRRNSAVRYEKMGQHDRARDALEYCLKILKVSDRKR